MNALRANAMPEKRAFSAPATPHQRLHIRCLMDKLELPWDRVDADNQAPFAEAGLNVPPSGMRFDAVLCALRRDEAGKLVAALMARGAKL